MEEIPAKPFIFHCRKRQSLPQAPIAQTRVSHHSCDSRWERNAEAMAALCDGQILKTKRPEVIQSLQGNYEDEYLLALRQAVELWGFYHQKIKKCDKQIDAFLDSVTSSLPPPGHIGPRKVIRHHAPDITDLPDKLLRLTNIPGARTKQANLPSRCICYRQEQASCSRKSLSPYSFPAGREVANVATGRKLGALYYNMMKYGLVYVQTGLQRYVTPFCRKAGPLEEVALSGRLACCRFQLHTDSPPERTAG